MIIRISSAKQLKFLITGGAGFIGSHLAEELIARGHLTIIYDNLRTGQLKNLNNLPVKLVIEDILNYQALSKAMQGCVGVFHLAALTGVVESMERLDEYLAVNLQGTINVLKSAVENEVQKVVFASSAAVYGDSPELPKREDMALHPKSPYAIFKLDSEFFSAFFSESRQLPTVCGRFFNVFGERQALGSAYAAAIPAFITNCLKDAPVLIYGDGNQTRDFIYVKDLVKAFMLLMEKGLGVYNIGYGKAVTVNRLVTMIKDYLNSASEIRYVPKRSGEILNSFAAIDKLMLLGFQPEFSLEQGLSRTIDYYKVVAHPGPPGHMKG
jgi:UDP-glucose 4-epimerase